MIVWPAEHALRQEAREGLRRFRETSAAAELEASTATWTVSAWPWTNEPPLRVLLENEAHDVVSVTLREGGIWLMANEQRTAHVRSAEALDREARGLPFQQRSRPVASG